MAAAAKLLIEIAADIAKLRTDFNEANKVVQKFGDGVKSVMGALGAGLSIAGIISFGEGIAKQADELSDMAENLKLSVADLQAFQGAALLAGQNVGSVNDALAKFNVVVGRALEGSKEQVEAFKALGITSLPADQAERLRLVAEAITKIGDAGRRSEAEVSFFGKSGQNVSAILEQLKKSTTDLNKELEAQGLIHSPEVIKQLADMADKSDKARRQIEVLFAPFYAAAKSGVFDTVASGLKNVNFFLSQIGQNTSGLQSLRDILNLVTFGLATNLAGGPIKDLDNQITAVSSSILELQYDIAQGPSNPKFLGDPQNFEGAKRDLEELQKRFADLNRARDQAATLLPDVTVTADKPGGGGGGNTGLNVKTTGVDKFTEAMTRLRAEIEATMDAIRVFEASSGLPSKEAERLAKLAGDIGTKQAQMIKGVSDAGQQAQIKDQVETLERLKFSLDQFKVIQSTADEVSKKFGDGQKELADRTYYLDKAFQNGKISVAEYDAALKEANETAERQALLSKQQVEGVEGVAAGFSYAALQMTQSQTDFQIGQDLFNAGFQTMSQAISEFVDKGTIDFGKLSNAFAKMLLEMAIRWAAMSFLRSAISGLGSLFGGGGTTVFSDGSTAATTIARANGGPVWPGQAFMVGEYGAEKFVPDSPGTIVPNGGGNVVINNYAQAKVSANRRNTGGGMNWEILIEPLEAMMAGRFSRGQGALAPAVADRFGLPEQGRR